MRLIDRICPAHFEACRTRWRHVGDCAPCLQRSQGTPEPKILPALTPDEHDQLNAVHEAGHAIAALTVGIPLAFVEIWRDGEGGRHPDGGNTNFGDDEWWAPLIDRFTTLWAGQEATDRWLARLGHGTDANRLDLRYVARHDATKFDTTVAEGGLNVESDTDGVVEARRLVDAKWGEIITLADALVGRRWMPGDEVRALFDSYSDAVRNDR